MLPFMPNSTPTTPQPSPWRDFDAATAFVQSLHLTSLPQWYLYCQGKIAGLPPKPADIPSAPHIVAQYRQQWVSYPHWLGLSDEVPVPTERAVPVSMPTKSSAQAQTRIAWRPFAAARAFVRTLKIRTKGKWQRYCKGEIPGLPPRPRDIPARPESTLPYLEEFDGYGDWLGVSPPAPVMPYAEAQTFVRTLRLRTYPEWIAYCEGKMPSLPTLPAGIPKRPDHCRDYRGQWTGVESWLGREKFVSFDESAVFVRKLGLNSPKAWYDYCAGKYPNLPPRPKDIPVCPHRLEAYAKKWKGWPHWMGYEPRGPLKFSQELFIKTREFVRALHLRTRLEWEAYRRGERPDLPAYPDEFPRSPSDAFEHVGWVNWADFLGSSASYVRSGQMTLAKARAIVVRLKFRTWQDFVEWVNGRLPNMPPRPATMPKCPQVYYAKRGWVSKAHFLGLPKLCHGGRRPQP